jgi:hypothetical protein
LFSKLAHYTLRRGKPYSLQQKNGKGTVEIQFNDGYITIHSVQPGTHKFIQDIHITRSAWYALLKDPRLRKVSRLMKGPDFDRYRKERVYYGWEQIHLDELRRQKREGRA